VRRLAAGVLLWTILLTTIAYVPAWALALSLTGGEYVGRLGAAPYTSRVLLAIRELMPLAVILLALLANPTLLRQKFPSPLAWCLVVLLVGFAVFMVRRPPLSLLPPAIVFVRFSAFFIMPFAVCGLLQRCNPRIRRTIARAVLGVLIFNLLLCLIQMRFSHAFEGRSFLGPRTIGMTNNPNTAGSLLALTALLMLTPAAGHRAWVLLLSAVAFFGTLTTGSRAAMGGLAILLALVVPRAFPKARIPVLLAGLAFVAFIGVSLNKLSGRYEQLRDRPESPRMHIARLAVQEASFSEMLVGRGLGVGTNSFVTLYGLDHELGIISDSLFTSWFMQFGAIGLLVLLVNTYCLFRGFGRDGAYFFLFFCLFSVTQNLIEVYPTNLLLMVTLGIYGVPYRGVAHARETAAHDLA
jgi:hypothetical protein